MTETYDLRRDVKVHELVKGLKTHKTGQDDPNFFSVRDSVLIW
jgi:hypothetical protein